MSSALISPVHITPSSVNTPPEVAEYGRVKACNKCGVLKSLDEFSKDRRNRDGRAGICKPCRAKMDWRRSDSDAAPTPPLQGPPDFTVLSLGAGVQSTTVLMMAVHEELPGLDAAIFADTGWEPDEVYRHLEWLIPQAERAGIPVHVVSSGNIRTDSMEYEVSMPLYLKTPSRNGGMLRRQCTRDYKIDPVRKKLVELIDRKWTSTIVDHWFGISWDEIERMSQPKNSWSRHRYPLVERQMTRGDCAKWMVDHGYPEPPRSACVCCPYRTDKEWVRIKEGPHWADVVEFDRQLRARKTSVQGEMFLHPRRIPLEQVAFHPQEGPDTAGCGPHCAT